MIKNIQQFLFNRYKENEANIHELTYLFWEATHRCNLKCRHCGSDCISNSQHPDMPFDDFFNAIAPLKKVYAEKLITVVIMGGEPLVRKDLAECGRKLTVNGFGFAIVTNGYTYTSQMHKELMSAGLGAITLSIDGLKDTHNWLRQPDIKEKNADSFDKVINALELIASEGEKLNYDIVTCVHSKNFNELDEIKEMLISKKARAWRIFTISPIGRAKENNELSLTANQLKELMEFIKKSREDKRINIYFSCEGYVGKYEREVRDGFFFCHAGINIGSVLIDGSISACPNINREFAQGNIYRDNFLDVWQNKFEIMRNRSWTKTGICKDCKDYNNCKGGAMHLWDTAMDSPLTCIHNKITSIK